MTVRLSWSLYFRVSSKSLHNISYQTLMKYRQGGRLDMLPARINQLPLPPDTLVVTRARSIPPQRR